MVIAEGVAALASLKSLYEIARDVRNSNDPEKLRVAASQMFDLALAAREQTAVLQEERNAAMNEITELKVELRGYKAWDVEKRRYELKTIEPGMFAYMLKAGERGTEPPHWLCPNCFEEERKSLFQKPQAMYINVKCPRCKTEISPRDDPQWL